MQDSGLGNPSEQERGEPIATDLSTLAAENQFAPQQPSNSPAEDAQLASATRNSVVLVITQHDLPKPGTNFGRKMIVAEKGFSLAHVVAVISVGGEAGFFSVGVATI
ncbi:MAG TPA: hypothetical protein VH325_00890 [Bryobacteraceae bacterium]|nr:hypothetical protein [Bryobacteraceae bacterium]